MVPGTGVINCKMKEVMKKITYLLIAAMTLVSVASCVKEQLETFGPDAAFGKEITVSLAPGTRTDLLEGKTVWAEGDQLWVSNGAGVDTINVPESAFGLSEFSFKTVNATPTETNQNVFVVYPLAAASKIAEEKVVVKVPDVQDGTFAAANICAGQSKEGVVALHNVTGILKVNTPAEIAAPLYQLVFSAAGSSPLAGECTVDLSGETPAVTVSGGVPSVIVQAGGFEGPFYAAVIPGTYEAGFKMTAATVDFEHASETKVTTVANTVGINEIVDLGVIGENLQSLSGEGTEASPWLIESLGHLIAISTAVDNGEESETFAGKYFKVANDIDGVSTSIGTKTHPFCGNLDGNGKTITLNIVAASDCAGLFGSLSNGADIHDLTLAGSVVSSAQYVGALVGYMEGKADLDSAAIHNVVNRAMVKGYRHVGGIAGRTSYTVLTDCVNESAVEGNVNVGGIVGHAATSRLSECSNKSIVRGTASNGGFFYMTYNSSSKLTYGNRGSDIYGTGGIAGAAQNTFIADCVNEANVEGLNKVGGILGTLFWSSMNACTNKGAVSASAESSLVGGILGYSHCAQLLTNSENQGSVSGVGVVGGIVGYATGTYYGHASAQKFTVIGCTNKGEITASAGVVGGICGVQVASQNPSIANVTDCVNEGKVSTEGYKAGGITAVIADCTGWGSIEINRCVNNGNVEAKIWVGGIVAYLASAQDYWKPSTSQNLGVATTKWHVYNCVNNGTVIGTRSDKDGGEVAGGIAGFSFSTSGSNANNLGLFVSNCLNTGDVLYRDNTHKGVYCGGIVGRFLRGRIYNVCNTGRVGPETGEPAEGSDARMGAIIGSYEDNNTRYLALQEAYYLQGTCGQDMGTASQKALNEANILNVASFDAEGTLSAEVNYNGAAYIDVLEALNAWVTKSGVWNPETGSGWYPWAAGPAFDI